MFTLANISHNSHAGEHRNSRSLNEPRSHSARERRPLGPTRVFGIGPDDALGGPEWAAPHRQPVRERQPQVDRSSHAQTGSHHYNQQASSRCYLAELDRCRCPCCCQRALAELRRRSCWQCGAPFEDTFAPGFVGPPEERQPQAQQHQQRQLEDDDDDEQARHGFYRLRICMNLPRKCAQRIYICQRPSLTFARQLDTGKLPQ